MNLRILSSQNFSLLNDTNKVDTLNKQSFTFSNKGNYDSAFALANQALSIAEKINYKNGMAMAYRYIGIVYRSKSNYPQALAYYLKGLKIKETLNDKKGIENYYTSIGNVYAFQAENSKALEYYFKALKVKEEKGDKDGILKIYNNIGGVFYSEFNYSKALEYFSKALKIAEETNNKNSIGLCYSSIAAIYNTQDNYPKCLEFYLKSLSISKETDNKADMARCYENISALYNNISDFKKAIAFADSSIKLCKQIGDINNERLAYERLVSVYSKTGKYKEAYEYHVKFKTLTDSIFNSENSKQLSDLKTNYEVEKKEAELKAEQEKKDTVTTAQKQKQRIVLMLVSFVLLLVAVFSALLYKRFRLTNQQKQIIEHKQKEITDSITYAQRLQQAILPPQEFINQHVSNNFVLYLPKDIVAGDFYWAEKINNLFFIAAADSTGHGVPGAMVSVVCSNALNRATKEFNLSDTGLILDKTRELVIETFEKNNTEVKDGMDISLLCIDKQNKKLFWSGANNPLWYIENNELKEIKANKQPIGKTYNPLPFTTQQIEYKENTTFYLFTDGFADQFGGAKGKKYKYKQLEENLLANNNKPLAEQKKLLEQSFNHWKGNLEQVDDVCIIGIKV